MRDFEQSKMGQCLVLADFPLSYDVFHFFNIKALFVYSTVNLKEGTESSHIPSAHPRASPIIGTSSKAVHLLESVNLHGQAVITQSPYCT